MGTLVGTREPRCAQSEAVHGRGRTVSKPGENSEVWAEIQNQQRLMALVGQQLIRVALRGPKI